MTRRVYPPAGGAGGPVSGLPVISPWTVVTWGTNWGPAGGGGGLILQTRQIDYGGGIKCAEIQGRFKNFAGGANYAAICILPYTFTSDVILLGWNEYQNSLVELLVAQSDRSLTPNSVNATGDIIAVRDKIWLDHA